MKTHRFDPIIIPGSRAMILGSLPPDTAPFYYSNSPRTRLWDLLYAVAHNLIVVPKGGFNKAESEKLQLLETLKLSMCDIILKYEREVPNNFEDRHIIPQEYIDIKEKIETSDITNLYFVYETAAKWFMHSLSGNEPVKIAKLKDKISEGNFHSFMLNGRKIDCYLLPSQLNRGKAGQTLLIRLDKYRNALKKYRNT